MHGCLWKSLRGKCLYRAALPFPFSSERNLSLNTIIQILTLPFCPHHTLYPAAWSVLPNQCNVLGTGSPTSHWFLLLLIYLFDYDGSELQPRNLQSWLWYVDSSSPTSLGPLHWEHSLSHWTTRKVLHWFFILALVSMMESISSKKKKESKVKVFQMVSEKYTWKCYTEISLVVQ